MMPENLDLRKIACPINFVRTKIKLDEMKPGGLLEVLLDDGEPIESVAKSVLEEGHSILEKSSVDNYWKLLIRRA